MVYTTLCLLVIAAEPDIVIGTQDMCNKRMASG
jgi:hypothetical protein